MTDLSNAALKIAAEQPRFWEHKLFSQILLDELEGSAPLRQEHRAGVTTEPPLQVSPNEFPKWIQTQLNEQAKRVKAMPRITELLQDEAFGKEGTRGDVDAIATLARELGHAYHDALEWSQQFRRVNLPPEYRPFLNQLAVFAENYIESIESLPDQLDHQIQKLETSGGKTIDLNIDLMPHNSEALNRESEILLTKLRS